MIPNTLTLLEESVLISIINGANLNDLYSLFAMTGSELRSVIASIYEKLECPELLDPAKTYLDYRYIPTKERRFYLC